MTSSDAQTPNGYEPRYPTTLAAVVFILAALTLCWPMLAGEFLVGPVSDQFKSGYSYRLFAAEFARQDHAIPQWNPYIFGGLPFIGAAHGDIFYPTAALRWVLPTDMAMNVGFAAHFVIAGAALYGLLRVLGVGWGGAVVGGLCYQLTGILVSLVHAGHDGKLFVSALTPALLSAIILAVRDQRLVGYGLIALLTGLILQGHPQTALYVLLAAAIWGSFWLFAKDGPRGADRYRTLVYAIGAVILGVGLYAIYALPMAEYVAHSPRAAGGSYTGWAHATSYSLPPTELLDIVLPRAIGGASPSYFGLNPIRFHTEYLGPAALLLAAVGLSTRKQWKPAAALATIAGLFLLVSLGGYTPFYRLWYAVVPLSSKLRAPGQAFVLVALPIAVFAGRGAERLLRGDVPRTRIWWTIGVVTAFGLAAAAGLMQTVAEDIARHHPFPNGPDLAIANRAALRIDGVRLLVTTGAVALVGVAMARLWVHRVAAIAILATLVWADLWVVGRSYFVYSPPAAQLFGPDPIVNRLRATEPPYRVLDLGVYPYSWLMASGVPTLLGHHGNELRYFDDLLGGQGEWSNLSANVLSLYAVRYVVTPARHDLPGFHEVLGPVDTRFGPAFLLEADSIPPYSWVVRGGVKAAGDAAIIEAVVSPQFPTDRLAAYPDTAGLTPPALATIPPPSARRVVVANWRPGYIDLRIEGESSDDEYLVVAENWYPDWQATVDGTTVPVFRANNTLLSVVVPPGAGTVALKFESAAYGWGKAVSATSLAGVAGLFALAAFRRRKSSHSDPAESA